MPFTFDIETDYLYKKGIEKGTQIAIEENRIEMVCRARLLGSSIEFIAKIISLPVEKVREILDTMKIE